MLRISSLLTVKPLITFRMTSFDERDTEKANIYKIE